MTIREIWKAGKVASVGKWVDMGYCSKCGKKIPDIEDEEVGFEGTEKEWVDFETKYGEGWLDIDEELVDVEEKDGIVYGKVFYDYDPMDNEYKILLDDGSVKVFCSEDCEWEYTKEKWGDEL